MDPLLLAIGMIIGYQGFRVFKLTISVWIALICGIIGVYISAIFVGFLGIINGETVGLIVGFTIIALGAFLFVWPLKFFNRTKKYTPNTSEIKVPNSQSSKFKIHNIEEVETSYVPNGHEERLIDNSKNDGYIKRRMTFSREWSRTISIEKSTSNTLSASIGQQGLANLGLEQALQDKYHVEINERKTFTEEIELEVLPRSKTVLRIEWKTIWQNGIIEITDQDQNLIFIPYKVSKGLTFDQVQEKVN